MFAHRLLVASALFLGWLLTPTRAAEFVEFQFTVPQPVKYRLPVPPGTRVAALVQPELSTTDDAGRTVGLTSRVALRLREGAEVTQVLAGLALCVDRVVAPQWFILQAPDAWTAARAAEQLAARAEVLSAHPVRRVPMQTTGPYAARFNDRFFANQWNLENRDANGVPQGPNLNVRAAWPLSQGTGVVIAICDLGVEISHPEFIAAAANQPHYNFDAGNTNGAQLAAGDNHGTAVAGYALAQGNNGIGVSGVAPSASLASWKMLASTEEQIGLMFQYQSNYVSVQNHSWLDSGTGLVPTSALAEAGLSNALAFGRSGRGVLMTRAAGNERLQTGANANDQAYTADPRVFTVAGVRRNGRVASYSTPGASVLVAAPVGDTGLDAPPTTDRQGPNYGYNAGIFYLDDSADYAFNSLSPQGTSFAAPQIAGLGALLLGANPSLTIRDVQQILALSARHFDFNDPDLSTNGAGRRVSHNVGYGVPDAGLAVRLAQVWSNRPPATTLTLVSNVTLAIPDAGFLVLASGSGVPTNLVAINGLMPVAGLHPDDAPGESARPDQPTASFPVVDVGQANSTLTTNLTGQAALIQRGMSLFFDKIKRAEDAGASLAIIYDNVTSTNLVSMVVTNGLLHTPAIFISKADGDQLVANAQTNANLRVQFALNAARQTFVVTNEMSCEHVGVRVQTTHTNRGNLRITVTSPTGTRSILQRYNPLASAEALADWTYFSTHHFFEPTAGTWTVQVSDEEPGATGSVTSLSLILKGVPIMDTDRDGLDDRWELAKFGTLDYGPLDDPDGDGWSNVAEFIIGSDPLQRDAPFPFAVDVSPWNAQLLRLSWPAAGGTAYQMKTSSAVNAPFAPLTNLTGRFPDGEVFVPYRGAAQFFRVNAP